MKQTDTGTQPEKKLNQNIEISTLCAFYGGLLTRRQHTVLQLHYDEDWSLAEIADHLEVSRQNVHELIIRSVQKLRRYETIVGGIAQAQRISGQLQKTAEVLTSAQSLSGDEAQASVRAAQKLIEQMIADINGEE